MRRHARRDDDRGQILALFAGSLAALLMVAAFTIDAGHAWWARRALQAGADAAALAAAPKLPDVSAATADALLYSGDKDVAGALNRQVPNTDATVTAKCVGTCPSGPNAIEVVQRATVETFFWRVLGRDSYEVSARAVARKTETPAGFSAIHSHEPCSGPKGLKFNGNNMNIQGSIHSNGDFEVDANTFTSGPATIHRPQSGCITKPPPAKAGITFNGASLPTNEATARPWPITFTYDEFCGAAAPGPKFGPNNGSDYTVSKTYSNGATLASGVYCVPNGKFELDTTNIKGTVSIVAKEILINATGSQLQPYQSNVILFQTGVNLELKINTTDWRWTGYMYSPFSHVNVNGSSATAFTGFIVGKSVWINGEGFKMIGTFPEGGGTTSIALVE